MKFELKDMYSFLLSHTFPGLLVFVEILLSLQWLANLEVFQFLQTMCSTQTGNIIVLLILVYAFSTLLGIILDGIHHFFFEDIWDIRQQEKDEKFKAILDNLKMDLYKHFLEDDLWYPYESYANIFVAMLLGCYLFYYSLSYKLHLHGLGFWIPLFLYFAVLAIILAEAICTYRRFLKDEEQFIEVYSATISRNP